MSPKSFAWLSGVGRSWRAFTLDGSGFMPCEDVSVEGDLGLPDATLTAI